LVPADRSAAAAAAAAAEAAVAADAASAAALVRGADAGIAGGCAAVLG